MTDATQPEFRSTTRLRSCWAAAKTGNAGRQTPAHSCRPAVREQGLYDAIRMGPACYRGTGRRGLRRKRWRGLSPSACRSARSQRMRNFDKVTQYVCIVHRDILGREKRARAAAASFCSRTATAVTGLPNRADFTRMLDAEAVELQPGSRAAVVMAVLLLNIDRFRGRERQLAATPSATRVLKARMPRRCRCRRSAAQQRHHYAWRAEDSCARWREGHWPGRDRRRWTWPSAMMAARPRPGPGRIRPSRWCPASARGICLYPDHGADTQDDLLQRPRMLLCMGPRTSGPNAWRFFFTRSSAPQAARGRAGAGGGACAARWSWAICACICTSRMIELATGAGGGLKRTGAAGWTAEEGRSLARALSIP